MASRTSVRLLMAASGTGGHLFPAIALAESLTASPASPYQIEWLGVPDRLETQLVPSRYRLHTIAVEGFQQRLGLGTLKVIGKLLASIWQVRQLLQQGQFDGVVTTGGYIAAPAILAARSLGLPVILHESNALPGKVTRWFSPWCTTVALGFGAAAQYLPRSRNVTVGTPVRSQFLQQAQTTPDITGVLNDDLPIPADIPLIVVVGGSQGAVAVNRLVRQCAPAWLAAGVWLVHLTGDSDPDATSLQHPHYFAKPFYHDMASLLGRATLVISRAGAGSLTELAVMGTPSILIPYPFAAEDHQTYNGKIFAEAGAALMFQQSELTPDVLSSKVTHLLNSPEQLAAMRLKMRSLAVTDSVEQLANLVQQVIGSGRAIPGM